MTEEQKLNDLVGQLSDLMNEKNEEAVDEARKDFSEKLKEITVKLSEDYSKLARKENDSYLLGYRRAMSIIYQEVDELMVDLPREAGNKKESDKEYRTEGNDYKPKVLTKEVIPTLQYMGEHDCTIINNGRPFITLADVWQSFEYNIKVAEPLKYFGNYKRYFNRIVNDFDIID